MTVFAIDPGPHTGIFWNMQSGSFTSETLDFTQTSETPQHMQLFMWLARMVTPLDTVICESFHFHKDKRDKEYLNYEAGEYVGVVKLFCQLNHIYYVMQAPAVKEQFWKDDKLKRVGLWGAVKDRHQRDAARHWLQYDTFAQNNQEWLLKLK
jgi:hypothetical protein